MPRRHISATEQSAIIKRAQERCEYCQSWMNYATQPFVFEHIIPLSRDGQTTVENLALACGGCNGHKYNKVEGPDPVDGELAALFDPRSQRWQEHFEWNEDYTRIVGLTATGRATVEALKLNRPGVVNMRKLLRLTGKHPPGLEIQ